MSNGSLGRTWARALDFKWKTEGPGGPSFPCCPQIWLGILAFFPFKSSQYLPQNITMGEGISDLLGKTGFLRAGLRHTGMGGRGAEWE